MESIASLRNTVIPSPVVEISLHLRQLFFRSFKTLALFVACPDSAPNMF